MKGDIRAYCSTCKRLVSDDLVDYGEAGVQSIHEHPVIMLKTLATLNPKQALASIPVMLNGDSYFNEVSQLDAEIITDYVVNAIKEKININLPKRIVQELVTITLSCIRQAAVDEMQKRQLAKIKGQKRAKLKQGKKEEPVVLTPEDGEDVEEQKR